GAPPANDRPFKDLDSFLIALFDLDVHPHGITRAELRQAFPHLLLFHFLKSCGHDECSSDWNWTPPGRTGAWRITSHRSCEEIPGRARTSHARAQAGPRVSALRILRLGAGL